ncbi:MAG: hypothetical protein HQM08_19825 [Candidatus Riflebacteria bacterium]|nr:hypothetical protein [Candidatus Riflebacteria bacterium]
MMQPRAHAVTSLQTAVFKYLISGLAVWSDVEFPSAISVASEHPIPEILIRAGDVPSCLEFPLHRADHWETTHGFFLLRLAGVGNFLIRDGREIVYSSDPACGTRKLALYLLGTCFAILLHQRGNLVLHASSIAVGDRAMLFCGPSRAGKSTLAALLCRRGYALLNDDVCTLCPAGDDSYEVHPDGRMLKLWTESLDELQWDREPEMAVQENFQKYYCAPPVTEAHARPVGAIYLLHEAMPPAYIQRIPPLRGMWELKQNAYRPWLLAAMEVGEEFFGASVALQRNAGVYLLGRQKDFAAADALLDLLEEHWSHLLPRLRENHADKPAQSPFRNPAFAP